MYTSMVGTISKLFCSFALLAVVCETSPLQLRAEAQLIKLIPKPKPKARTLNGANRRHTNASTAARDKAIDNLAFKVKVQRANIRSSPGTNSRVIIAIDSDSELIGHQLCGGWVKVSLRGRPISGWIYNELIDAGWQEGISASTNGELDLPAICPRGW